jgi:serine phosphatase RsbU (regulator of sigma subunit)
MNGKPFRLKFHFTISRKLLTFFVIVALVPLGFVTFVTLRRLQETMSRYNQAAISTNLRTAWGVYNAELEKIADGIRILSLSPEIKEKIIERDTGALKKRIRISKRILNVDLINLIDRFGNVLCKTNNDHDDYALKHLVREVLKGKEIVSTEVFTPKEVDIEDDMRQTYAQQLTIRYRFTPKARPLNIEKKLMGMALVALVPVMNEEKVIGAVIGVQFLARNFRVVDKIVESVGEGTATIFQDDVRISTNVRDLEGKRAMGTRVSEEVYNQVIKEGRPWNSRAFVVTDWYISSYEPIKNYWGDRIGILYVGTKEAFFTPLSQAILRRIYLIVIGALLFTVLLSLKISRTFTQPILRIIEKTKVIAQGKLDTKIDVQSEDELGELAEALNTMSTKLLESRDEILTKQRMERELEIAYHVQKRLLIEKFPEVEGLEIAGECLPALEVGGDFYDLLKIGDGYTNIVIGDVAGKGMPAAMFMGIVRSIIRAEGFESLSASEVMAKANRLICLDSKSGMFVTIFYAIYDEAKKRLEYCNAGHVYPMLYDPDLEKFTYLNTEGRPLGITTESNYVAKSCILKEQQVVVLHTDGVVEAVDANDVPFGEGKLRAVIRESAHASADEIVQELKGAVNLHRGNSPQSDDITLIVLKVRSNPLRKEPGS